MAEASAIPADRRPERHARESAPSWATRRPGYGSTSAAAASALVFGLAADSFRIISSTIVRQHRRGDNHRRWLRRRLRRRWRIRAVAELVRDADRQHDRVRKSLRQRERKISRSPAPGRSKPATPPSAAKSGSSACPGPAILPSGPISNLQALADNGGPTPTMALGYNSSAIDAGDPSLGGPGMMDQRGVSRPQGSGVDIGAYERPAGFGAVPRAADVTAPGGTSCTFTVAYSDSVPIDPATLGSGNVVVNGALDVGGAVTPAVRFVGADAADPTRVVVTYAFTPPSGSWDRADNGTYTIALQPSQVGDANGFFPAGPLGRFVVAVPLLSQSRTRRIAARGRCGRPSRRPTPTACRPIRSSSRRRRTVVPRISTTAPVTRSPF